MNRPPGIPMNVSSKQDNRPSEQMYPDDLYAEAGLLVSSLAAQGLWWQMLWRIMWPSPQRGSLLKANGKQVSSKDLAKLAGISHAKCVRLLSELGRNGVYSTDLDGTIYNRRMRRKWQLSRIRAEAGRKGGKASKNEAKPPPSSPTPTPTPTSISCDGKPPQPGKSGDKIPEQSASEVKIVKGFYAAYNKITGQVNSHTPTDNRISIKDRQAATRWFRKKRAGLIDNAEANKRLKAVLAGEFYKSVPDTFAAFEAMYDKLIPANRKVRPGPPVDETPGAERSRGMVGRGARTDGGLKRAEFKIPGGSDDAT